MGADGAVTISPVNPSWGGEAAVYGCTAHSVSTTCVKFFGME